MTDKSAYIELEYPRNVDAEYTSIIVGLIDVRAADDIRISYDFDRDGWKIEQASIFEWDINDPIQDSGWKEVAFIQAWGQKK